MPSPLEILLDPVSLIVFALYAVFVVWEAVRPARRLPRVRHWRLLGFASFAVYFFASTYLPLFWDGALAEHRLLDLTDLGLAGGTLVGLLVYEFGVYAWHRAMHASPLLFRVSHQMHHSAERIDSAGTFYFGPLDMVGLTALWSLTLVLVVGISPQATTATLLITTALAVFQHTNVRTPRWLGYLVQRPESHSVHHQRGVHAKNYADLPVIDWLFGTLDNPETFADEAGFYDGASGRVVDMLLFRDVTRPPGHSSRVPVEPHPNPVRGRLNAAFFWLMDGYMHWKYGARKRALFADLPNEVVELGAGAGANFRYMSPGTRVIAVEPNPHMHAALRKRADRYGIELSIRGVVGSRLTLSSDSAQAVVCSLVLCTVEDPAAVLSEVRRVLAPGGRFLCIEHVAAPEGSVVGKIQRWVLGPWQWAFEGCHTHRETGALLQHAGFDEVQVAPFELSSAFVPVRPHIVASCTV